MVKEATANELGMKVGGQVINMIRCVDDKAVVASSEKNLERLMDSVSRVTQEYGMKIYYDFCQEDESNVHLTSGQVQG